MYYIFRRYGIIRYKFAIYIIINKVVKKYTILWSYNDGLNLKNMKKPWKTPDTLSYGLTGLNTKQK